VHERVGKLESSGVIQGYRAEVRPEMIGLPVTARHRHGAGQQRRQRRHPCYFMAGSCGFMAGEE